MELNYIISLITILVSLVAGQITKKFPNVNKKVVIPIQNLVIGLLIAVVDYIITKDFSVAIAASGLLAGGTYDLVSNLTQLSNKED